MFILDCTDQLLVYLKWTHLQSFQWDSMWPFKKNLWPSCKCSHFIHELMLEPPGSIFQSYCSLLTNKQWGYHLVLTCWSLIPPFSFHLWHLDIIQLCFIQHYLKAICCSYWGNNYGCTFTLNKNLCVFISISVLRTTRPVPWKRSALTPSAFLPSTVERPFTTNTWLACSSTTSSSSSGVPTLSRLWDRWPWPGHSPHTTGPSSSQMTCLPSQSFLP